MKNRWICFCLLAALLPGMIGCAGTTQPEQTVPPTTVPVAESVPEEAVQSVPEQTQAADDASQPEGYLFLTVSEIAFSVIGESEDIYVGSIPREQITWETGDPAVATFDGGILTAVGVGQTTVTASCGASSVSCSVRCLADSPEALAAMDPEILRSPKRMPFVVDQWPEDFFDDAAFVGDSITYTLWHTAGKDPQQLGNALFLVRGGTSINGFVLNYKNIYYRGVEMKLDDAIKTAGVKKVFFMLGQNDLGYMSIEETMDNWTKLLDRVKAQSPDVEIYIQSLVPEWLDDSSSNEKNEKIDAYNEVLKAYCEENGYYFIEIAAFIEDHTNRMATVYSMDNSIHINYDGTAVWMDALKAYVRLHELRGE